MVVLDSSALLAVLLDEAGADIVGPVMRGSEMSIVNVCEVLSKAAGAGGDVAVTRDIISSYGIRIRPFLETHADRAARLRPLTAHLGLSLGDRACLAQGMTSTLPVLTADRRMAQADVGLDIRLIR